MWKLAGLAVLLLAPAAASAQDYSGTFTVQNQQGGLITLTLTQDAQGGLTGTMSGNNERYQMEGMVDEGIAVGAIYNQQGGVFFEAQLQDGELLLTMIEPGPNNEPDYSKMQDLVLTRQTAAGAQVPQQQAPAPGVRPTAPTAANAPRESGLLGGWSCQTPDGPGQLNFGSQNQLTYNGESSPYEVAGDVIQVPGEWGPVQYSYLLQGGQLLIQQPDGSTWQCQRQQAGQQVGGAVSGTGMEAQLQGKLCSYSASPDGGYSTQHLLFFNGQGRFWYGVETAWDIPETTGVSTNWENGENIGDYQVTGTARGSAVYLRFADGQVGTARVYHVYQGTEITELFLEGPDRHYGKGLCP